jgi:hypothetical protein
VPAVSAHRATAEFGRKFCSRRGTFDWVCCPGRFGYLTGLAARFDQEAAESEADDALTRNSVSDAARGGRVRL